MPNGDQDYGIELGSPAAEIQIEVDPRTPLSSRERAAWRSEYVRSAAWRAARRKALTVAFFVILAVGGFVCAQVAMDADPPTTFVLTLFGSVSTSTNLIIIEIVGIMQYEGPGSRFSEVRMIRMLLKLLGNVCGSILPMIAVSVETYGGNKVSGVIAGHRRLFYFSWTGIWLIVFSLGLGKERMPDSRKQCLAFAGGCVILGFLSFCASYMTVRIRATMRS